MCWNFNTINGLSNKACVPNETKDLNLSVLKLITRINESKTLTKHISCECKCKFDETKCNLNQSWNNDKCQCECKKYHICEKEYVWNPSTLICQNGKYIASIVDDLAIICDDVIESHDEQINFSEKKAICITQNFYIFLFFC